MSNIPQSTAEHIIPAPVRNQNVIIGKQSFLPVLCRAIAGELYKIRRRTMSKVLSTIAIMTVLLTLFFTLSHTLPETIETFLTAINIIGPILFIILAGTIVGDEYSVGSIRLMLTRGPTRLQFLLAKLGALLICVLLAILVLLVVDVLVWLIITLSAGAKLDLSFLTSNWNVHTTLSILTTGFSLFSYCALAVSLSSWGKATAAGVTGTLIWWFLEGTLSSLIEILGRGVHNVFGDFIATIPNYFIGNNLSALRANQQSYLAGGPAGSISDLQASIVIIAYLVVFTGLTWWSLQTRDITS